MAFMDGIKKWVNPLDDDDDDYYDEYDDFASEKHEKVERGTSQIDNKKVVNIHAKTQLAVVLVKPDSFENTAEIADNLKEKRTVVLNLERTEEAVARRIVDFLSGVAYAIEGQIKRIANRTFIITPYNVDILGDLIDELENSGLY